MDNLIDITGYQKEEKIMNEEIKILYHRFMALAMDYQFYKNKSFIQNDIYRLRDEVHYRFKSVRVQVQVLFKHQQQINKHLDSVYKNNKEEIFKDYWPSHPLFDQAQEEISSLFDSFIYHLTSIFDYLGNLTNHIFGKNSQQAMNWNSLARSTRDSKNEFSLKSFADTIKEIDNQFVTKLYKHRSVLIHERSDIFGSRKYTTANQETFFCKFISTKNFNKRFSELRKLGKEKFITLDYVIFWLFRQTSKHVNQVLFSLKKELELNPERISSPTIGFAGPKGRISSPSEIYWKGMNPLGDQSLNKNSEEDK